MKITLMEDATLYINKNKQCKVELGNNIVLFENDSELESLKKESPDFFALKEVTHENKKCILNYEIEEGYQSFFEAKGYSTVIRLSLLERVLELDPLSNYHEKVLLHPRNIYFKDLKTIKFLYRSNQFLPSVKNSAVIDQYKLLILSMLSHYSYEQFSIKKIELLEKEKDNFLDIIENAATIPELKELIRGKLFQDETNFFKNFEEDKLKNKVKTMRSRFMACGLMGSILAIAVMASVLQIRNYSLAADQQLKNATTMGQAYELLANGETDKGLATLKGTNPSDQKLAQAYFISKQYDNAINTDSDYAKIVVSKLYETKDDKKILGLQTDNKYIKVEKHILSYDRNSLLVDKEFIQDQGQLARMGYAFLKNNDIAIAKGINVKLKNESLEQAIQDVEKAAALAAANVTP